jgi:hypothetical protein
MKLFTAIIWQSVLAHLQLKFVNMSLWKQICEWTSLRTCIGSKLWMKSLLQPTMA